jgi:cytochrome d ubiquinol oxidase subunit II
MDLNTIWFLFIGFFLAGYLILDGYDLGIGILHLFTRDENRRRQFLAMVGPYWDGNEVWLIVMGASIFAAFPPVYACLTSGLYLQVLLLLLCLIMRAVTVESRSKFDGVMRRVCDYAFGAGSLLTALLLGVVGGNFITGLPIDEKGLMHAPFWSTLKPLPVFAGLAAVLLVAVHGAIYAATKVQSPTEKEQLRRCAMRLMAPGLTIVIVIENLMGTAWFTVHRHLAAAALFTALVSLPAAMILLGRRRFNTAFVFSCAFWLGLLGVFGLQTYPRLIPSNPNPANSLTIYNSSASPLSLKVMFIIALITVPVVIVYYAIIYLAMERGRNNGG